jgi:hypothetical protein
LILNYAQEKENKYLNKCIKTKTKIRRTLRTKFFDMMQRCDVMTGIFVFLRTNLRSYEMTTNSFPGFERNIPIFICCDEKIEKLGMFESKKDKSKKA